MKAFAVLISWDRLGAILANWVSQSAVVIRCKSLLWFVMIPWRSSAIPTSFYSLSQLCLYIIKTQQASSVPEASPAYKRCLCFFHSISTSLPHPSTVLLPFGHLFKHYWLQLPSYPHQNRPPPASFPPLAPLVCRSHLKPGLHLRLFQVINSHQ